MALFLTLTLFFHLVNGFRNAGPHKNVADLLDMDYKPEDYKYIGEIKEKDKKLK